LRSPGDRSGSIPGSVRETCACSETVSSFKRTFFARVIVIVSVEAVVVVIIIAVTIPTVAISIICPAAVIGKWRPVPGITPVGVAGIPGIIIVIPSPCPVIVHRVIVIGIVGIPRVIRIPIIPAMHIHIMLMVDDGIGFGLISFVDFLFVIVIVFINPVTIQPRSCELGVTTGHEDRDE
jgi:hypothetical protein